MSIPDQLRDAAQLVRAGNHRRVKVRTLLRWFGHKRRGSSVVWTVRRALRELGLRTNPDFSTVGIDAFVNFTPAAEKAPDGQDHSGSTAGEKTEANAATESLTPDPALYVGMLPAATRGVVSVTRDNRVSEAVAEMMIHNYSQLPVTQDLRHIDGMISWRSIGVARTKKRNGDCEHVRDCLDKEY